MQDLGPLPKGHPRDSEVLMAQEKLCAWCHDARIFYHLTSSELAFILAEELRNFGRRCIAIERRQEEKPLP
jgi:hypothetical protein